MSNTVKIIGDNTYIVGSDLFPKRDKVHPFIIRWVDKDGELVTTSTDQDEAFQPVAHQYPWTAGEWEDYEVKDSGQREEFETGSRRDTRTGKGRFDLISPLFAMRLARHLEKGAEKYGDRNWELGQPSSRALDSLERHINALKLGMLDEDHAAAAVFNLMVIIHNQEAVKRNLLPATLLDLPDYQPKGE